MITRKLHCVHDLKAGTLAIALCILDDIERPGELKSSTDGIVAMETRTLKRPTVRGWRTIAKRTIALPAGERSDVARSAALAAFAYPDVTGIVIDVGGIRHRFRLAGLVSQWVPWSPWRESLDRDEYELLGERPLV